MTDRPEEPVVGAQYTIHGRTMTIIHVDHEVVTFRDLNRPHTLALTVDAFITEVNQKSIVPFAKPPGAGSKALAFLNPMDPAVIAANYKLSYIEPLYKQFFGSLPVVATEAFIAKKSEEISDPSPPCYNSVYKWMKKYLHGNCDRFCLLKDKSPAPRGKRLEPEVESIIKEMIEQEYLKAPPIKMKTLHRFIHAQIILINRRREAYSTVFLKPPSLSTIQRKIKKLCHSTSDKARYGNGYIKKHHQSSALSVEPLEVLDTAEIDSHLMDINIIDVEGNVLGKILWMTTILEIKTRCIIGWEISTTYPCAEKTIRALKKALLAVPGHERLRGKPIYLDSDNGSEFDSDMTRNFLDRINILFNRGPPYVPNARADMERWYLTFEQWLHEQHGTTMSNPIAGKHYDARGEAAFTEAQMVNYAEDWIENIYHQKRHNTLNMPPAVAWERAMHNRMPPEKFTEEDLDILYRGVAHSSISAAGRVRSLCLSWYGPELPELRLNLKKKQQAIIYYNPLDLGEIWVAHPDDTRNPKRAYATCAYQKGLTLTEHNLLHKKFLADGKQFDDSEADLALYRLRQQMAEDYENSRQLRQKHETKHKEKVQTEIPDSESVTVIASDFPPSMDDSPTFEIEQL